MAKEIVAIDNNEYQTAKMIEELRSELPLITDLEHTLEQESNNK